MGVGNKNCITFFENRFCLTNSVDTDEMLNIRNFICVFNVCQSTHLGVTGLQRVKIDLDYCDSFVL